MKLSALALSYGSLAAYADWNAVFLQQPDILASGTALDPNVGSTRQEHPLFPRHLQTAGSQLGFQRWFDRPADYQA